MDISACIGSGGSADGFDLYFNNDINILATTVTEVTSPSGNIATVSVNNGVWLASFDDFNTTGMYYENGAFGLDCIDFGIIVSQNINRIVTIIIRTIMIRTIFYIIY